MSAKRKSLALNSEAGLCSWADTQSLHKGWHLSTYSLALRISQVKWLSHEVSQGPLFSEAYSCLLKENQEHKQRTIAPWGLVPHSCSCLILHTNHTQHAANVQGDKEFSSFFGRENVNIFYTHNPHILLTFTKCAFNQEVTRIWLEGNWNVSLTHGKYRELWQFSSL